MKLGFIAKKIKTFVSICVCVRRDVCMGQSGLNQIICESILHMVGKAQYVEGVLQGVVGVD